MFELERLKANQLPQTTEPCGAEMPRRRLRQKLACVAIIRGMNAHKREQKNKRTARKPSQLPDVVAPESLFAISRKVCMCGGGRREPKNDREISRLVS